MAQQPARRTGVVPHWVSALTGRSGVDNRLLNSHPYIANSTNEVNEALRDFFDPLAILIAILRHPRRVNAGAAIALALTTGGVALARSGGPVAGASITVPLPEARPLFSQASAIEYRSTGEQARVINASMPFLNAPPTPAQPFILTGDDNDRSRALLCLSQAVYYEANGEPETGQRAVAQVVLNRVRHPAFAKSVCGVVYEGAASGTCQFSFVCNGSLDRRPKPGAWRQAQTVARQALYGYVEPSVGEATHYHADYVAPFWAPQLAKVAAIGQHIFYRWRGASGQPSAFTGRYAGEAREMSAQRLAVSAAEIEGVAAKPASATTRLSYQIAALLEASAEAPAAPVSAESKPNSAGGV